jgi:hypothetical protein
MIQVNTDESGGPLAPTIYVSQTQLLEGLRDIWPQQKGLAALLFQDDLFSRLRRLEAIVEGGDDAEVTGFLPEYFPDWEGSTPDYESAWTSIGSEARAGETESLDTLEDQVCAWCEDMIPESIAFFDAALDTGDLDERWLHAAEALLAAEQPMRIVDIEEEVEEIPEIAPQPQVLELVPEPVRARPTRRRRIGLPLTPSRVRRIVRQTRRHPHSERN